MEAKINSKRNTDGQINRRMKTILRSTTLWMYYYKTGISHPTHKCKPTIYEVYFNLLKPTGYVMHQQFNIQQLYALPTLFMCFVFI